MATKYEQAVTRATGDKGGEIANPNAPVMAPSSIIMSKVDEKDVQAMLADNDLEFAPQLAKMEEGDMIHGVLEGNGPEAEFEHLDKTTGVITTNVVKTWIIASMDGRQRISILSSAQLDRKLPGFVGGAVKIVRGKDINTSNGQRVTNYLVGGPRSKDGHTRNWATRPVLDVTDHKMIGDGNHAPTAS